MAGKYMDAMDKFDDEQLHPDNEDYENYDGDFHSLDHDPNESKYPEPEYDGAEYTEEDERAEEPEYIIDQSKYNIKLTNLWRLITFRDRLKKEEFIKYMFENEIYL